MSDFPEVVIIKKKSGHHGHHGGAWKVAYADFVTAMMALFIVLWLMNTSKPVQEAVSGYFRDPRGVSKLTGSAKVGTGDNIVLKKEDMHDLQEALKRSLQHIDPLNKLKNQIEITITEEGLRIELMESAKGTFFELGSAKPTPALTEVLQVLAQELGKLPNRLSIEGHTDSTPYAGNATYDNWNLSSDRANEARRLMQQEGMRANQVSQVRGFADQRLRFPAQPFAPSNRRISLIVQYQGTDGSDASIPDAVTKMNADKSGDSAPTANPDQGTAKPDETKEGTKNAAPAAKAGTPAPAEKPSPLKSLGHLFHK